MRRVTLIAMSNSSPNIEGEASRFRLELFDSFLWHALHERTDRNYRRKRCQNDVRSHPSILMTALHIPNRVHLYSRILFARELSPALQQAAQSGTCREARVISVLDSKRSNINKIDFQDLDLKKGFGIGAAANHCMAMNDVGLQVSVLVRC